jgi:hypothetical protein
VAALSLGALSAFALADDDPAIVGVIDSPQTGASLTAGQRFTVKGWMVDQTANTWAGIDAIGVTAQQPGQRPIDLGQARLAQPRPDVAAALNNPRWMESGYTLEVAGLPAGAYTLALTAQTPRGIVTRGASLNVSAADDSRWTAHGFNVNAPRSIWPMLELLHEYKFDWALAAASRAQAPIVWADLPTGMYGQYSLSSDTVRLSTALESTGVEAGAAFLVHELTHLTDDVNGVFGADVTGAACYEAEVRAFSNEANLWSMIFGRQGKRSADKIEAQQNLKMRSFVGKPGYVDLVLRTTAGYVRQCGVSSR